MSVFIGSFAKVRKTRFDLQEDKLAVSHFPLYYKYVYLHLHINAGFPGYLLNLRRGLI